MITILQTVMLMLCFVYKTKMQMSHFYQRESKKWMEGSWEKDETFLCIFKHYLFWCTTIFNLCAFSVFTYHSITTASAFFFFLLLTKWVFDAGELFVMEAFALEQFRRHDCTFSLSELCITKKTIWYSEVVVTQKKEK